MQVLYYKFLQLLIEKPISNVIINIILVIIIQIISKRVIWAEEYYHPFMGKEVISPIQEKKGQIQFIFESAEKKQKMEIQNLFDKKMCENTYILLNPYPFDINAKNLDPRIFLAYHEIIKHFKQIYMDTLENERAAECIKFCKNYIPLEAWDNPKKVHDLNNLYSLLNNNIFDKETVGRTLFFHTIQICLEAKQKDYLDCDAILIQLLQKKINEMFTL